MAPRARDATATPGRSMPSRRLWLASSSCVALAAPAVRWPGARDRGAQAPPGRFLVGCNRAQQHASGDQRLTVPQGVRSPGVLRGAPGPPHRYPKRPWQLGSDWPPMRPSQMPNRRSLRAKSRRARRKSTRRNSGQYGSTNTHSAYAACQSRKPDSRASPLVLITRSGSGRSAV